jgi:hypothetical protein
MLSDFDAVDELTNQFEDGAASKVTVDSSSLALGALAEVLILRQTWRKRGFNLVLRGRDDARHAAISHVVQQPHSASTFDGSVGARSIVGSGQEVEDATMDFASVAARLARDGGMPSDAARLMQGAFGELTDNIGQHAGQGARGLAAFELGVNSITLVVADTGQGIVNAYLESQPDLRGLGATDALEWAVRQHRSRFKEAGRGTGFRSVLQAMRAMDASLRVRSDDGSLETEGAADQAIWMVKDQAELKGFVVSLRLTWK